MNRIRIILAVLLGRPVAYRLHFDAPVKWSSWERGGAVMECHFGGR